MAAGDGPVWTFEQLGGPRKKLTLSGWSAPFGRPREEAVVRTPIKVRAERTRYPGGTSVTRHVFGHAYEDWELHGRFRDRAIGQGRGGAQAKCEEVKAFVLDQQPVSIAWGDVLLFHGFLIELDPGYEGPGEIEWKLKIEIDEDAAGDAAVPARPSPSPRDFGPSLLAALEDIDGAVLAVSLPGSIGDVVSNLLGVFDNAVAAVLAPIEDLKSFKDATFADINRTIAAVRSVRRAGVELREVFVAVPTDAGYLARGSSGTLAMLRAQAEVEDRMRAALADGARVERAATLALFGRIKGTVVAGDGDSWESLSMRAYGQADRGTDLRDANGVGAGGVPIPGREYLVPV